MVLVGEPGPLRSTPTTCERPTFTRTLLWQTKLRAQRAALISVHWGSATSCTCDLLHHLLQFYLRKANARVRQGQSTSNSEASRPLGHLVAGLFNCLFWVCHL